MRKNALNTVRYAEFGIPSCNSDHNESIHIGKHLVPVLRTFMPHLQTLCLWRPDDFPWTSSMKINIENISFHSYFKFDHILNQEDMDL